MIRLPLRGPKALTLTPLTHCSREHYILDRAGGGVNGLGSIFHSHSHSGRQRPRRTPPRGGRPSPPLARRGPGPGKGRELTPESFTFTVSPPIMPHARFRRPGTPAASRDRDRTAAFRSVFRAAGSIRPH